MLKAFCSAFVTIGITAAGSSVFADTWRGTAPFCEGECLPSERAIATSDWGDGGYCITGKKVLCQNPASTCVPRDSTEVTCIGLVLICDNGCSSYACGPCLLLDDVNILSAPLTSRPAGVIVESTALLLLLP